MGGDPETERGLSLERRSCLQRTSRCLLAGTRCSYMSDVYDFWKPHLDSEYPVVSLPE